MAEQEAMLYGNPRYGDSWASPDGIKRDRDRIKKSLIVIIRNPGWFACAMTRRMKDRLSYVAEAPLVFRSADTKLIEAAKTAEPIKIKPLENGADEEPPGGQRDIARRRALAFGESISWARPLARALQRVAKETTELFMFLGAPIVLFLSRRRGAFLLIVPLYYLLVQSTMHTEFRYTLPIHYFMFVFAAIIWVVIGASIGRIARTLARLIEL